MDTTDYKNCPVGKYHDFKVLRTPYEIPGAKHSPKQVEQCRMCHKTVEYLIQEDGKMVDDRQYFLDHIRAFAQPSMVCYYELHPTAAFRFAEEAKAVKKSEEFQETKSEEFKAAIKKALD